MCVASLYCDRFSATRVYTCTQNVINALVKPFEPHPCHCAHAPKPPLLQPHNFTRFCNGIGGDCLGHSYQSLRHEVQPRFETAVRVLRWERRRKRVTIVA